MSHATRTRGLIILTVLLTAVIIVGLLLSRDDDPEYATNAQAALEQMDDNFSFLSLEAARDILATGADGYVFIDLRSPDLFVKGHLEGAKNIPLHRLLEPATLERLQDSAQTYVLYGREISEGASACALLHQLGMTHIRALQGCYSTYSSGAPSPVAEAAQFDFQAVFEEIGAEERGNMTAPPTEAPKTLILPARRATQSANEGC